MTPNNYKDQFTEWLESKIAEYKGFSKTGYEDEIWTLEMALDKCRSLAPAWIPVTETMPDIPVEDGYSNCSIDVLLMAGSEYWVGHFNYLTKRFESLIDSHPHPTHYQIIVPPINKEQ